VSDPVSGNKKQLTLLVQGLLRDWHRVGVTTCLLNKWLQKLFGQLGILENDGFSDALIHKCTSVRKIQSYKSGFLENLKVLCDPENVVIKSPFLFLLPECFTWRISKSQTTTCCHSPLTMLTANVSLIPSS
jgi:hypothetical protein